MTDPKFSVIVPVYRGAAYIGEAIRSVLEQTYPGFELIVVNDASPDNSAEIVAQFDDPRLKMITHEKNQGSDAARHTGLQASRGEVVAFLDQDDTIHPEKLQAHAAYLEQHPETGFTYNARFELDYSASTIRDIWRPPRAITLADLVLGFPIAPSDAVIKREWVLKMDIIGRSLAWTGGEIIFFGGLYLDGCKFGMVDRALNYRRHHDGRRIRDLAGGCAAEIAAQDVIFSDQRCPADVLALRNVAHTNMYMFWAYRALAQDETKLGQDFLRAAARLKPDILNGAPCELMSLLLVNCIDNERIDHAALLKKILDQLPAEMAQLSGQYDWAVAQGYLLKGARAFMWDRLQDGRKHFEQAKRHAAQINEQFVEHITHSLLDYETEFGEVAAGKVMQRWVPELEKIGKRGSGRRLAGAYAINRAFESYHDRQFRKVAANVLRALVNDPRYLANRGVLSMFLRSIAAG